MLGKLLKYEAKSTARLFLPLYLTILIFAVINRFLFGMPDIGESLTLQNILMTISMIVYITLFAGMMLMTLIVMIQRFYKNLLGDEGYLMFTLPVQSWKHILSKLSISMFWTIVSSIVAFFSILIIASREIFIPGFYNQLSIAFNAVREYLGASTYLVGFEIILLCLLSLASTILTIYASIAVGHLFNKYKLLASFGMYIVFEVIAQIFSTLFIFIFSIQASFGVDIDFIPTASQINTFLIVYILYFLVMTTGYFALTNYILKKKLNLE